MLTISQGWQRIVKWIPLLAFVLILPLLLSLGFWQLARMDEKQQILQDIAQQQGKEAIHLSEALKQQKKNFLPVTFQVTSVAENIYLDNQIVDGQVGVRVITPVITDISRQWILLDRGWLPYQDLTRQLPDAERLGTNIKVNGVLYQPSGRPFGSQKINWQADKKNLLLAHLDMHYLELAFQQQGEKLIDWIVYLNQSNPYTWQMILPGVSINPKKHLAYAIQWFALALTLCIIFFVLLFKRKQAK